MSYLTGTLTRNVTEHTKCSVAGTMYNPDREYGNKLRHMDLVENLKQVGSIDTIYS